MAGKMFNLNFPMLALIVIVLSLWSAPALGIKETYIVYMGEHSDVPELTKDLLHNRTEFHIHFLGSYVGCTKKAKDAIISSYRKHINGFAAKLDENEVVAIKKDPRVVSVFLNQERKLLTTRSWEFLSLERNGMVLDNSLWKKTNFGEDIIIGNIDSGVWPESPSFNDDGLGPIPSRWKGRCQDDETSPFPCNRKLIGAKYFYEGYIDKYPKLKNIIKYSPRDYGGHGTHTLSTAGGSFVQGASVLGLYNGTTKGGAPKARVAAYKACWGAGKGGCTDDDIIKAFDHAINDRVDVLSLSIGGIVENEEYWKNSIAIGSFHAIRRGIPVVAAGGNDGPKRGTITNGAPWLITVGASTVDRKFSAYVHLQNGLHLQGAGFSRSLPQEKLYPLISSVNAKASNASVQNALLCKKGALDPERVKGHILVCLRGGNDRLEKGENAALAGAVGMIICNDESHGGDVPVDYHFLPAVNVNYTNGVYVFAHINNTKNPMGFLTTLQVENGIRPAPVVSSTSSRGPYALIRELLKPDIIAPGKYIVAAYTEASGPTDSPSDKRRTKYMIMSGTSMSCPHVAGVVGLLKRLQPDWSPAAIRSALVTTATPKDNTGGPILDYDMSVASPFAYGAGHIRPQLAADPGLVYDVTPIRYTQFLCEIGYGEGLMKGFTNRSNICSTLKPLDIVNLNYPSIIVPQLSDTAATVHRRVKNVGPPGTYVARVQEPPGVKITLRPNVLHFSQYGVARKFRLTMTRINGTIPSKDYVFGELVWSDKKHNVRSPIAVGPAQSADFP